MLTPSAHHRQLRSSLEAEVDLILPNDIAGSDLEFVQLLQREGAIRATP
jgi:hypothetical protein